MTRRYAQGTKVSADSSRAEMTGLLTKYGVRRMAWGTEPDGDTLQFELGGNAFRFYLAKPTPESLRERDGKDYTYAHNIDWERKADEEWLRIWRAHVLLLKAKLEFIDSGATTLDREFMAYRLLADGKTVEEAVGSGLLIGAGR